MSKATRTYAQENGNAIFLVKNLKVLDLGKRGADFSIRSSGSDLYEKIG
jgi:hypothetical protein